MTTMVGHDCRLRRHRLVYRDSETPSCGLADGFTGITIFGSVGEFVQKRHPDGVVGVEIEL
jgi:hypothetical protein